MTSNELTTDLTFRTEIDLYFDLYVPPGISGNAPLLIAVHGYGAHKRYMMREARLVAGERFVIASIQAPHPHYRKTDDGYRIGYGWLSDEKPEQHVQIHHRFVNDVIKRLSGDGLIDAERVVIYGFSQACALNFRFAFTFPETVAGVVGVCGGIPGDLETNDLYKPFAARTFYLYGDDDEFYMQERFASFDATLDERLPNYTSKHYKAKHEITNEMREDIKKFLVAF